MEYVEYDLSKKREALEAERLVELRDEFAMRAMAAALSNTSGQFGVGFEVNNLNLAHASYAIADAMLEARK